MGANQQNIYLLSTLLEILPPLDSILFKEFYHFFSFITFYTCTTITLIINKAFKEI